MKTFHEKIVKQKIHLISLIGAQSLRSYHTRNSSSKISLLRLSDLTTQETVSDGPSLKMSDHMGD